jgi:uncharacterized membrane protein YgaE (UPF0421/DUF939 family)
MVLLTMNSTGMNYWIKNKIVDCGISDNNCENDIIIDIPRETNSTEASKIEESAEIIDFIEQQEKIQRTIEMKEQRREQKSKKEYYSNYVNALPENNISYQRNSYNLTKSYNQKNPIKYKKDYTNTYSELYKNPQNQRKLILDSFQKPKLINYKK